jgi:LmbE family N-acetylglucosaminyl deacetylase
VPIDDVGRSRPRPRAIRGKTAIGRDVVKTTKSAQEHAPSLDDRFAGTTSKARHERPVKADPSQARPLDVRLPRTHTSVQGLLAALRPPRADQTVLELGAHAGKDATAAYAHKGAQVTAFVMDAEAEKALLAEDAFHHVEQRGAQPLGALGLAGRFDVVVARPADLRDAADTAALVRALAPGGALVLLSADKKPPKALLAAAEELGLSLARHTQVGAEHAWVIERGGARRSHASLDRITCVDRERVADLMAKDVVSGPASLTVVPDDDTALRDELDALMRFAAEGVNAGALDVNALPFPSRVASSATQGTPGLDALVVFAHPDDESGYAAGALAKHAAAGKSMHLVVATDGAGGVAWQLEDGVPLAQARAQELKGALEVLGVGGHSVLGLPDAGMYQDDHRSAPVTAASTLALWGLDSTLEKLVRAIRTHRPRALLGFDLERDPGYSLHGHHVAMGFVTALAVHVAADPRAFPEQKLAPWSVEAQWAVIPADTRGGTQEHIDVDKDKKIAALKAHRSQFLSVARLVEEPAQTEHWHRLQGRVADSMFISVPVK